ncbi:MAG: family 4C encapsulin nanocompartment shell protein [Rhodothermales bacterium]
MTVLEYAPSETEILDFIHDGIRQLQEAGSEPRYILMGTAAYATLRRAIATRFQRTAGTFESYQYLPIVVDPLRDHFVCVLPSSHETANDVALVRSTRPG